MAQTITYIAPYATGASDVIQQLMIYLSDMFDFVLVDTANNCLYYTSDSYIKFSQGGYYEFNISVANSNGEYNIWGNNMDQSGIAIEITKTVSGDILIRCGGGDPQVPLSDNNYIGFALIKCKDAVSENDTYGVYIPYSPGDDHSYYSPAYLVTDDSDNSISNFQNVVHYRIGDDGAIMQLQNIGYFAGAPITILIPIYATSSRCYSTTSFLMGLTPRPYYGNTLINNKHYYCCGYIAMLDE